MTQRSGTDGAEKGKRDKRLAEALRANLKRRKARARPAAEIDGRTSDEEDGGNPTKAALR